MQASRRGGFSLSAYFWDRERKGGSERTFASPAPLGSSTNSRRDEARQAEKEREEEEEREREGRFVGSARKEPQL